MVDKDFAWRLAQELVRIDSSDPGAYEGEIERHIKALVEERLARLNHPTLDAARATSHDWSISAIWIPSPWATAGTQAFRRSEQSCVTINSMAAAPAI